ncbi:hypothetical protein [Olivibacter domesticus]|uniref:Uncharacterized protein n=1 Tax=Olivibacter domesticus TaxID=407022 RepID=A0A1H7KBL4_OLID1|nr:hypothetical protein [Olivibacter domesticus]SEK83856.1 hypothetical protein SAMN05661044_01286 [Olivibacter domesticus]
MYSKYCYLALLLGSLLITRVRAQEMGLNFNHNPENMDFNYIRQLPVKWVRTTPRILDYVDGKLDAVSDTAIQRVVDASKMGYQVVFGFRWDFKNRKLAIPVSGSPREADYFRTVDQLLERVGPYIQIFTLGNEPNLETINADLQYDRNQQVPLVQFTERLLMHVLDFYKQHPDWSKPRIYTGSLPALFEKKQQQLPGVVELIKLTQRNPEIEGLAVHLHIGDTLHIPQALDFARSLMPKKPIIIPEFSLFRLYNRHFGDRIANSAKGKDFVQKYRLPANIKLYQWLNLVHSGKVTIDAWEELFLSQDWYPAHYLLTYHRYYKHYGVVLATYPLLQQGFTKEVKSTSASWFLNPLFLQKSFGLTTAGEYEKNPLVYADFLKLLRQ